MSLQEVYLMILQIIWYFVWRYNMSIFKIFLIFWAVALVITIQNSMLVNDPLGSLGIFSSFCVVMIAVAIILHWMTDHYSIRYDNDYRRMRGLPPRGHKNPFSIWNTLRRKT